MPVPGPAIAPATKPPATPATIPPPTPTEPAVALAATCTFVLMMISSANSLDFIRFPTDRTQKTYFLLAFSSRAVQEHLEVLKIFSFDLAFFFLLMCTS